MEVDAPVTLPVPVQPPSRRAEWARFAGRFVAIILAVTYVWGVGTFLASNPDYDSWDMLAYMGTALLDQGVPPAQVRTDVYQITKDTVPDEIYQALTGHPVADYRAENAQFHQDCATKDDVFLPQLRFYSVKPLYPLLMAGLNALGINLIQAGVLLSAASWIGFAVIAFRWVNALMPPLLAFVVGALLVVNPWIIGATRDVGPDMMSVALLFGAAYFAIERRSPTWAVALLMIAIPTRPENVIYAGLFILYLAAVRDLAVWRALAALVISVAVFLVVSHGNYGWRTLLYYTFIHTNAVPTAGADTLTPHKIANLYLSRVSHILTGSDELPVFMLIGFGALCLKLGVDWKGDRYLHLIVLAALLSAGRLAILPQDTFRALLAPYMMLSVAMIEAAVQMRRAVPFSTLRTLPSRLRC